MRARRTVQLTTTLVVLCLISLLGAGCLGRGNRPPVAQQPWRLNLPRLNVRYDEQGEPTVLGSAPPSVGRDLTSACCA